MVANIQKVQAGLVRYIDTEMLNHMDGWQKIGFGAVLALIIKNLPNTAQRYMNHPLIQALGIMDEDKNIDIDALRDAVVEHFGEQGEYVNIPMLGRVKFTKADIEALYNHIKEA